MNIEIFQMAFASLLGNKTRTLLSMLGVIIGVSTVIIVVGIGLGSQEKISEQYKNMSVESIMVMGGMGPRDAGAKSKVSAEDVAKVLASAEYVKDGVATVSGNVTVASGKISESYTVLGTQKNLFSMANLQVEFGKNFSEDQALSRDKIVILGNGVAEDVFEISSAEIVGKTISINKKNFEVIGVLKENGVSNRMASYDDSVFVPFEVAEKTLLGSKGRLSLQFLANGVDNLTLGMEEIRSILRTEHSLKDSAEDDFRMFDAGSMISSAQSSAKTMTILLTSVAAIVLLVSGIGIMNVMLVSVVERTKEIGIMKAIGAKQISILLQFLWESVLLCLIGGIFGVLLGFSVIPILNSLDDWFVLYSFQGIIVAFFFSVTVGIFFGFYPALRASKLDPVDALRSE